MAKDVKVTADNIRTWRKRKKIANVSLLVLLLVLILIYILLKINYSVGSFSVKFNSTQESGIAIKESAAGKTGSRILYAEEIQFMDNISIKWLPEDIDDAKYEGSHNGKNYIAYTFYVENQGKNVINYWYSMYVDDVIRKVDDAIRIILFLNGEPKVYAKGNPFDGNAEKDTTKWLSYDDGTIILEQRKYMKPTDLDRITVVVFIEGDDPECTNDLLGGMLKMHMEITEEHIDQNNIYNIIEEENNNIENNIEE